MIAEARALLVGAGARAFFWAQDRSVVRGDVRDAWRALRAAERGRPPHRASFEAVRLARESGLPAEALTFGDTPVSLAASLLRDAGVGVGGVVVDPLAGRGHVLLAARLLGAVARGVELDPGHVELAAPLMARAGAGLVHGDARLADYAGATCVYLAWTCLDAPARAAVLARVVATAPNARLVVLTWEPAHPAVTIERRTRALFPWGRVDVVQARVEGA